MFSFDHVQTAKDAHFHVRTAKNAKSQKKTRKLTKPRTVGAKEV